MNQQRRSIPTQTLLGGQLHNLAYITPSESHVLRSLGGGVTPSGGQQMANGIPSYGPNIMGLHSFPTKTDEYGTVIPQQGGSPQIQAAYQKYKRGYDANKKLSMLAAEGNQAAIDKGGIILYDPKRDYEANPAKGIVYQANYFDKRNNPVGATFRTPTGQTIGPGNYGGVNAGIPLPMGAGVSYQQGYQGNPGIYTLRTSSPSGGTPGVFVQGEGGTYRSQDAANMALMKVYERDLASGRIDRNTGKYLDPRVPNVDEEEEKRNAFYGDASQVGLRRYEESGNPRDLLLRGGESEAATAAFRAGLLAEQQANPLPNAGINLLQSGLVG